MGRGASRRELPADGQNLHWTEVGGLHAYLDFPLCGEIGFTDVAKIIYYLAKIGDFLKFIILVRVYFS
jgi:hypothetical protein